MIEHLIANLEPPVTTMDWVCRFLLIGMFVIVVIEKIWEERNYGK